jgi:hypothetical protein
VHSPPRLIEHEVPGDERALAAERMTQITHDR